MTWCRLNHCRLSFVGVLSSGSNFTASAQDTILHHEFEIYTLKIIATPREQWYVYLFYTLGCMVMILKMQSNNIY